MIPETARLPKAKRLKGRERGSRTAVRPRGVGGRADRWRNKEFCPPLGPSAESLRASARRRKSEDGHNLHHRAEKWRPISLGGSPGEEGSESTRPFGEVAAWHVTTNGRSATKERQIKDATQQINAI